MAEAVAFGDDEAMEIEPSQSGADTAVLITISALIGLVSAK